MSDYKINVEVDADTSEAQKKLDNIVKEKRKISIEVDSSDIDEASKKVDGLKNKDVQFKMKTSGKETVDQAAKSLDNATKSASGFSNTIKGFPT